MIHVLKEGTKYMKKIFVFWKMFVILQDEEEDLFEETPDAGKII